MNRNRYDIDETLERHLDLSKLGRMKVYIKPHLKKMAAALVLIALSSVLSLFVPALLQTVIDEIIPMGAEGTKRLLKVSCMAIGAILLSALLSTLRNVLMAQVGQDVIYDIRRDLFDHLQKLPFSYYDSRPHGKILVRVVNYVNAVSDTMTNGILNAIVDLLNIIFISVFMFSMDVTLSLYVLAGLPLLIGVTLVLKKYQRNSTSSRTTRTPT